MVVQGQIDFEGANEMQVSPPAPVVSFVTKSPFNQDKLPRQTKAAYEYLLTGKYLNTIIARDELKIGFLNSRIPEIEDAGIKVYRRRTKYKGTECCEYSLTEFKNPDGQ